MNKLKKLKDILKEMGAVLVAYSGGVDSTFLLRVSKDVLKNNVLAVIADSALYPRDEIRFSKQMARQIGTRYKVIKTGQLNNRGFLKNNPDRCYLCKRELFSKLKIIARRNRLNFVLDGTNVSDRKDFRPGEKAIRQLDIRSPLREAGFNKEEIRRLSKNLGLSTYNKPNFACLASRIAYGTRITKQTLRRIGLAEKFIRSLGFRQVRVRDYGKLARIEVDKEDICKLVDQSGSLFPTGHPEERSDEGSHNEILPPTKYRGQLVDGFPVTGYLKKLGYDYITVDLEGYRSGSMNEQ